MPQWQTCALCMFVYTGVVSLSFAVYIILLTFIYQTTFFYFGYTITIASPFVIAALFIFGASGFGDFDDLVTDIFPLPSIQEILGLESEFLDVITGLVGTLYGLIQDGVEAVVDLILSIPSGSQFDGAVKSQFSGCCITLFFLVTKTLNR